MRAVAKGANAGLAAQEAPVELTILIPCLNEAETLASCVRKAHAYLNLAGITGEVLVSDNGSTDGSIAIAEGERARVVHAPIAGYGGALACGIAAARGRYVVMGDADDSYDFSNLSAFVAALREGNELVMGNRFKGEIAPGAMPLLHRYLGNPVLSAIGRLFFRAPIGDFHCGLRGFDRAAILALELRTTGMEFATEMVVAASLRGLKIAEVPTGLAKDGRSRPPHLRTWRDGWRHLRFLLLHSPRWAFGYPGTALLVLGTLLVGALLPGKLALSASVSLDIRAFLIGCTAIVVGVQAIAFGLIARRFASAHNLLPPHRRAQALLDWVSLERLLQFAGVLACAGVAGIGSATTSWANADFGAINDGQLLRVMVLSVSAIVIAVQLGLSGLLLGVLDLRPGDARAQQTKLRDLFPE
jgi:glycosyltransferase involved in cell wall biosynthesis